MKPVNKFCSRKIFGSPISGSWFFNFRCLGRGHDDLVRELRHDLRLVAEDPNADLDFELVRELDVDLGVEGHEGLLFFVEMIEEKHF